MDDYVVFTREKVMELVQADDVDYKGQLVVRSDIVEDTGDTITVDFLLEDTIHFVRMVFHIDTDQCDVSEHEAESF